MKTQYNLNSIYVNKVVFSPSQQWSMQCKWSIEAMVSRQIYQSYPIDSFCKLETYPPPELAARKTPGLARFQGFIFKRTVNVTYEMYVAVLCNGKVGGWKWFLGFKSICKREVNYYILKEKKR